MASLDLMRQSQAPKLVAGGLTLLLLGGGIGALATRPSAPPATVQPAQVSTTPAQPVPPPPAIPMEEGAIQIQGQTYRLVPEGQPAVAPLVTQVRWNRNSRPPRARVATQRAYYNYDSAPVANRRGSWWQRNRRDVLTIAAGTGLGAGIGALAGGKKGAGIGALAGGGGAALYTYGVRRRN
ncbi:MAG: hypothetical protein CFK52_01100 [Chloracidobacterium sp. CP2_5A]|nr:MAG: hypothetical protein CFK52_01100 [Chloracidobacterium sp. CP2_5A]